MAGERGPLAGLIWPYDETTMLRMHEFPGVFAHTDHHRLRRVG
jgi:hypothetical protein